MKKTNPPKSAWDRIPKSARNFMDKEIADDAKRRRQAEKMFSKTTISYVHAVQDACSDLLHFGFKDLKKVEFINVTIEIELKNGAKLGRTTSCVPNMPKRVGKMINDAGKRNMKKVLRGSR